VDTILSHFRSTPVLKHVSPNVILQYPSVFHIAVLQCFLYGTHITLIPDTGGHTILEWIWEWLFGRELSGSGYLYFLRSVFCHLWFLELRAMWNIQVNVFQHQISCFVRRPPVLPSVGLLLVVLKRHLVLSFLFKWLNGAFSLLLAPIDWIILMIFACLPFVNFISYFRPFSETSNKNNFWYRHISSGPYQEY